MGPDGGMPAGERAEAETAEAAAGRGPKCIWRRKAEAETAEAAARGEFAYAGVCRSSCRERIETHMAETGRERME